MSSPLLALLSAILLCFWQPSVSRGDETSKSEVRIVSDVSYKQGEALTDYEKSRCKLDLYLPANGSNFPALVWFHGGGLTGGKKDDDSTRKIAERLARAGIAIAAVNYRLSPKVTFPAYVEDAASAFAWVRGHIAEHGGDPAKVFMGGHSAGAYLSSLVGMDARYLQKLGLEPSAIAGLIPVSGQMMTHFTVRKERGIPENTIVADEAAPIYHTRKDPPPPPFLILFGDHDWPARLEENQYFVAMQKTVGNSHITLQVIADRNHGSIAGRIPEPGDPVAEAIIHFINQSPGEAKPAP
jgi:acetyl esterase/lipase